jgi:hypothetical protein
MVEHHKEDTQLIKEHTSLSSFNKIYSEGQSLFHYFAHNLEVVEMLHRKFKEASFNNSLAESEE